MHFGVRVQVHDDERENSEMKQKKKRGQREAERESDRTKLKMRNPFKVSHTNYVRSNEIRVRYGRMFLYGVT